MDFWGLLIFVLQREEKQNKLADKIVITLADIFYELQYEWIYLFYFGYFYLFTEVLKACFGEQMKSCIVQNPSANWLDIQRISYHCLLMQLKNTTHKYIVISAHWTTSSFVFQPIILSWPLKYRKK